jgi:hypothetical protein
VVGRAVNDPNSPMRLPAGADVQVEAVEGALTRRATSKDYQSCYNRGEPVHQAVDIMAVSVTVLLTGCELTIGVFVHPVLSKLQDAAHAEAAKPLARLLGKVMPLWYAAALIFVVVSLFVRAIGTQSWWACLASAALLAVTVPFSLICLVPINNRVAAWDLNALPGDWKNDRRRWDQYHSIRTVILALASVAIMAAVLW